VEPQLIWPAIVASAGGVPELAFVSEVPNRRTLVDHSREKFRPGLHKASFWNDVLLTQSLSRSRRQLSRQLSKRPDADREFGRIP